MSRKALTDEQLEKRREEILDAAMALFEATAAPNGVNGLDAVSFRKIAAKLGCSYTALYRYYSSKESLVDGLRARAFVWIREAMLNAIDSRDAAATQLRALSDAYIQAALERPQRYSLMFFNVGDSAREESSPTLERAKRQALDVATQVIADGQKTGEFPSSIDPLTSAHMFWIGAHGLVSLQVGGQLVMGRELDELEPLLISVLSAGLNTQELIS